MRTCRNEEQIAEKQKERHHTRLGSSAVLIKYRLRKGMKKKMKLLLRGVFVFGHPSRYECRKTGLNFVERTTRGSDLVV